MLTLFPPTYTPRDYAILRDLFESRIMTRVHLCAIHFDGHARMTKKRLQKLARAGLVATRPRRPGEAGVHFLTKHGYDLLHRGGQLAGYPPFGPDNFRKRVDVSPLTLAHELAVMDVKSAFYRARAAVPGGIRIAEFLTWPLLFRFRARLSDGTDPWVYPDARIRLEAQGEQSVGQSFYLEVDRGTETLSVLQQKAAAYLHRAQTDGRRSPFRVLWVFPSVARRNHAADILLTSTPPVLTQAWLTTMQEVTSDPLGAIWTRPIDRRENPHAEPLRQAIAAEGPASR